MNKNILKSVLTVLAFGVIATPAQADLVDASLKGVDNHATYMKTENGMQINVNNGGMTTANWDKLNVNAGEALDFNFRYNNSTVFNQINSLNGPSIIAGSINAIGNGAATSNIILSNTAGVTFANGSVVNVGALTVNSDKNILVEGLNVKKGNLFLNASNGRVDVKGLLYDKAGDLTIRANGGNVAIGGIQNAATIDAQTNKGIYVKAEDFKVGGKTVSGITSEYIKLASTSGNNVNVEGGKIIVGKDFLILTEGRFINNASEAQAGEKVEKTVTKNGTYYHIGWGGSGSSEIENATVTTKNGTFKVVANRLTVDNSTINDFTATSNNFQLLNSTIKESLSIAVDGSTKNNTPTTIINSKVANMEMEYSNLKLQDAKITNLNSIGVAISKLVDTDKTSIDNLYLNGGSIALNANDYIGKLIADNNASIDFNNITVAKAMELNGIKNLNLTNMKGAVKVAEGSKINGTVNVNTSNFQAAGSTFNKIEQVGGTVALTNSKANSINSNSSKTYSDGTLTLIGSTINNSLTTNSLYNVNITNSTVKNPASVSTNWLNLNDTTLALNGGKISNSIIMNNSNLKASNLKVINCLDAQNSTLNIADSSIGHHLILNDTNFIAANTSVNMNAYLTKSNTNNAITMDEVNMVNNTLGRNGNIYIGYTPNMGDYKGQPTSFNNTYSGNVDLTGSMMDKGVKVATIGDVKLNLSNVRSLAIDNANSVIVEHTGALNLDKIVAQGNIQVTADSLKNAGSTVGTIDSKSNSISLNIVNVLNNIGTAVDADNRTYNIMSSNSNIYNVYNFVPVAPTPVQETISETITNYVNTLNVNNEVYNMPNQPQTMANQFARNVRSLAVDSNSSKDATVSELQNGIRLELKIMP